MKKLVSIILLLCLVCLSCTVYASEPPATEDASVNIKFETVKDENKITIKISTGKFDGVKEGSVMSASMSLVYDDANISKVSGKTTDNWKITISDETKMVLLENDKANSNTQFVELTFELRDVKEEKTGTVSIKDFNISDGNLLDEKYPTYSVNYTIKPEGTDENNNNNEENNIQNQITNETLNEVTNETTNNTNTENIVINTPESNKETGSTVNNSKDNTIAPDSKLPQTGVNIFFIVIIAVVVAFAVVKLVKYKDIEIK
jgi:hypothetical protein